MTEITINLHDQPCGNCTVCIGRTIGAKHEQERIIKLLEGQKKIYNSPKYSTTGGLIEEFVLDSAIALIKGEK